MYIKRIIALIFLFAVTYLSAQYQYSRYNNPKFLENIVHTILVNNNFHNVDVIQNGVGKIHLKGRVDNYYQKIWLYEAVIRIPGVREVSNEVVVDNPSVDDALLANHIQHGIQYVSTISNPDNIKVEVNNGIVFLSGKASDSDEKNTAHKIAAMHEGVRGIVNKIEVPSDAEILLNTQLRNFLQGIIKERYPDEKNISVSVKNGEVTLSGSVSSDKIKEEITDNIKDMKGISTVNNQLTVETGEEKNQKQQ